jgi:hypothetical protein
MQQEITEGWRKLHSEELYNLYSSLIIIGMNKLKEAEMGVARSMHEIGDK